MQYNHRIALALLAAAIAAVACSSRSSIPATGTSAFSPALHSNSPPLPTAIPLLPNNGDKAGFHLELTIAGTKQRNFLFDTGSGGLWVYRNALNDAKIAIHDLNVPAKNTYGSGLEYYGDVVTTTVDFGSGLVAANVPLVRVDKAICVTNSCISQFGRGDVLARVEKLRHLYGTFGADVEPRPLSSSGRQADLYNALFALGSAWTTFAVTPSQVQAAPAPGGFTMLPLAAGPTTHQPLPNGAKSWNRDARVCYTISGTKGSVSSNCMPTVFDTGASGVTYQTTTPDDLPLVNTAKCGQIVRRGSTFVARVRVAGAQIGSFTTGPAVNWNEVHVTAPKPSSTPAVNTGLTFYNRNDVLFDGVRGRVGFRPLSAAVHNFITSCKNAST